LGSSRPSSFKQCDTPDNEIPKESKILFSNQQNLIFSWFESGTGNLVVRARAGTGKTFSIIEGVNRAPEDFILVCAFNKKIAEELSTRIMNPSCEAKTLHSLGFTAIRRQWSRISVAKGTTRADYLTDQVAKAAPKQIRKLISNLHTKLRDMLGAVPRFEEAQRLALFFDLVPDESWGQYDLTYVVNAVIGAMTHAKMVEPRLDVGIDFADMIYLPLVWNLLTPETSDAPRGWFLTLLREPATLRALWTPSLTRICCSKRPRGSSSYRGSTLRWCRLPFR
jgi:hypothetical protein